MKTYFNFIQITQKALLALSIALMLILPLIIAFKLEGLSSGVTTQLYNISHIAVFFVMIIRPLADIYRKTNLIRPLVILRKGAGVFSASIILSFIFAKIIMDPTGYVQSFITVQYWSLNNYALLAHLADISAIVLVITSNNLSRKLLKGWWKKIQKLSYIYFYASATYVFLVLNDMHMLISMFIITAITMFAYSKNKQRLGLQSNTI